MHRLIHLFVALGVLSVSLVAVGQARNASDSSAAADPLLFHVRDYGAVPDGVPEAMTPHWEHRTGRIWRFFTADEHHRRNLTHMGEGDAYVHLARGHGSAVFAHDCENLLVDQVTVHASPGLAVGLVGNRGEIRDRTGTAIYIGGASQVTLRGNTLTTAPTAEPRQSGPAILLERGSGITLLENAVRDPRPGTIAAVQIGPTVTEGEAGVRISDLDTALQPSAIPIQDLRKPRNASPW